MKKTNTKKLVISALFVALSLTLFMVEAMIPPVVPIPGIKIGLAYIPIIFIIFIGGVWRIYDALLVLIARILLSALVSGNLTAMYFAAIGGTLSLLIMGITRLAVKQPWASIPAGIFSAVGHNIGQLAAASTIYTMSVWAYLPWLIISAVLSGLFTGILTYLLTVKPHKIINKIKYIGE